MRCQIVKENGEFWFWGGYFFKGHNKVYIDGFNLLNEEEGIPDKPIIQHGMGFGHDCVLIEEAESTEIVDLKHEHELV